jgi:signal recognition particle subunit SRP54
VLLLDTAGRLHVDQALMDEMKAVASVSDPDEVLLVVDIADWPGCGQRRP